MSEEDSDPLLLSCEQKFGGVPGAHTDCAFYCDYMSRAVVTELASVCVQDAECWGGLPSSVALLPAPATLCLPQASFAIASSCSVPDSAVRGSFAAALATAFGASSENACLQTEVGVPTTL